MARLALIPGDGIGPEVVRAATDVMRAAAEKHGLDLTLDDWDLGADRYLRDGTTLTPEDRDRLVSDYDAALLGALGDPRVPENVHARDILLGLRAFADLYVNYRPCKLLVPALSPLRNPDPATDIVFFRENTEGLYAGVGGSFRTGTADEIAIEESLNTYKGVERIVRAAFEHARTTGRTSVTLVDKANVLAHEGGLWRRVFGEVGSEFPGIDRSAMYVDAMAMDLVRRPQRYEVVVTSNLFGDILSDLAAQVTGGLGLAPSGNINPESWALFEPVHGSAPDIAGKGIANPVAAVACVSLAFEHLGMEEAAVDVDDCIRASFAADMTTPDLGGTATTREVGRWMAARLLDAASG
ncbi:MAG: isocitrate/isopropylmalate dehydrogenase family protein [Gemmatimonadetes bacterium]|nr:isocitrate/isopropylmalate dehydrogenase family protein [Gemmatimonadota bacterium]